MNNFISQYWYVIFVIPPTPSVYLCLCFIEHVGCRRLQGALFHLGRIVNINRMQGAFRKKTVVDGACLFLQLMGDMCNSFRVIFAFDFLIMTKDCMIAGFFHEIKKNNNW